MASGNDMKAAEETYSGFISLLKWGQSLPSLSTAAIVVLLIA